jgi:hypothetical protein
MVAASSRTGVSASEALSIGSDFAESAPLLRPDSQLEAQQVGLGSTLFFTMGDRVPMLMRLYEATAKARLGTTLRLTSRCGHGCLRLVEATASRPAAR